MGADSLLSEELEKVGGSANAPATLFQLLDDLAFAQQSGSWQSEYNADAAAVTNLLASGYSLDHAIAAGAQTMKTLSSLGIDGNASLSHPSSESRIEALRSGERAAPTLELLAPDDSWQVQGDKASREVLFDHKPWVQVRQVHHALFANGRLLSVPYITQWREREVIEDGVQVHYKASLKGTREMLERTAPNQESVYRDGKLMSTRDHIHRLDGSRTVISRTYVNGDIVNERQVDTPPPNDGKLI